MLYRSTARSFVLFTVLVGCVSDNQLAGEGKGTGEFDTSSDWTPPDTDTADTATSPGEETCNGIDDDGDGEVDEGYPDSDGDGIADCVDCPTLDLDVAGEVPILEACEGTAAPSITDPWDVGIEWQYNTGGSAVIVMPAVGNMTDDNGDGVIDDRDIPDIAYTTWGSNQLELLSGDGSGLIFSVSGFDGQGGVTIADADGDGDPEIVAITPFPTALALVDGSGRTEWTSATFGLMAYPQPTVADLDGDGLPEVIADVAVVNGEDGSTVAELAGVTNSWRTPIAADLDQDGDQEIILGNVVYDHTGKKKWSNSGTGDGNFAAVADVDGDAGGEVIFVSGSVAYVHDDDGSLIRQFNIPGTNPGPPAMADFDGDGEVEIAIPANSFISVFDIDGTKLWQSAIRDSSGLAGCSGYDVNGDGAYEVLYADETDMRIYDGSTGTVLYDNVSHDSATLWEYPVTADVDKDGSAEIVYASNGATNGITVLGHNGSGWAKSGETWATHDFAVTNIDPDGGVPVDPDPSWQKYNVFRARPIVDDPASSDLVVTITDVCVATCDAGPVEVGVGVYNQGGAEADAGVVVYLYADTDTGLVLVASQSLPAIPAGSRLDGLSFEIDIADLGKYGFVATIDEPGVESECDESNNRAVWIDVYCP
jgi:hypothetical protein